MTLKISQWVLDEEEAAIIRKTNLNECFEERKTLMSERPLTCLLSYRTDAEGRRKLL